MTSQYLASFACHPSPRLLSFSPNSRPLLVGSHFNKIQTFRVAKNCRLLVTCSASGKSTDSEENPKWASWIPFKPDFSPEKILRLISGATSSPICQFIDKPRTFLHSLDPRVKLVWLLGLVVIPARSNIYMRFALILYLAVLSIWILPSDVWKNQLGRVALLSGIVFIIGFGSDGFSPLMQTRAPPSSLSGLPNIPPSLHGYSYSFFKFGPLHFTRKGLNFASTTASLTFTIFQSASLCLTTTTPEQFAFALWWFMNPLRSIGVPVSEIILTLLLSLRFISLVIDEVRDGAIGIVARRVNWGELSKWEIVDIFFSYIRRIFKNIFNHSEQISKAMIIRGFRGDSENHNFYFKEPSFVLKDFVSLLCFFALFGVATLSDRLI